MKKRLKLISSGADKQIVVRSIQPAGTNFMSSIQNAQVDVQTDQVFQTWLLKKEQCKHKVLSMDIAGGYGISGHDKYIQLWQVTTPLTQGFDKLLDRKIDSQKKSSVLDHIRVVFGPSNQTGLGSPQQPGCEIVIASCADKSVTIYETATGNAIAKTTCGEVTTAMCLSTNLKHLITASMDGIIYFWRLPENLTKALIKLRSESPLATIKTEAPKLPLKFQSPNQNQNGQNQIQQQLTPDDFLKQDDNETEQERKNSNIDNSQFERDYMDESSVADQSHYNQQPPPSISMIMQQINQVTSKIEKIQPLKNRNQFYQNTAQPEEIEPNSLIEGKDMSSSQQNLQTQKRRNVWGAKTSPTRPPAQVIDGFENSTSPQIPVEDNDEGIRAPHFKNNNLPRWAQSMAGFNNGEPSNAPEYNQDHPFNEMKKDLVAPRDNTNDIDDIFEGTLEKFQDEEVKEGAVSQGVFYRPETHIDQIMEDTDDEDITPVKSQVPPKPIDFLSTMTDKQQQSFNQDDDPDEAMIREQLRIRNQQHKPMLGLDSDDEDSDQGEHRSQHIENSRVLRKPQENRQSQSQLFLQRKKEQQIQDGSFDTAKNDQILKVEDIFNETTQAELQNLQQKKPIVQEQPKSRYEGAELQNTVHSMVDKVEDFTEIEENDKPHESQTSDAMVKIIEKQKSKEEIKETNVNNLLKEEISKINQSLFRINQCLNGINVGESSELSVKIQDDVAQSLNQSLDLWNTVAHTLGKQAVPLPQASVSHSSLQIRQHNESASNISSMPNVSLVNQSIPLSSSISIKDDARDLLERYSDLLMAEVLRKINSAKQV